MKMKVRKEALKHQLIVAVAVEMDGGDNGLRWCQILLGSVNPAICGVGLANGKTLILSGNWQTYINEE